MAGTLSISTVRSGRVVCRGWLFASRKSRKFDTPKAWQIYLTRLDCVLPKTANVIRLPPVAMRYELSQRIAKHYHNVRERPHWNPERLVPMLCGSGRNESVSLSLCNTVESYKHCTNRTGVSCASLHPHLPRVTWAGPKHLLNRSSPVAPMQYRNFAGNRLLIRLFTLEYHP